MSDELKIDKTRQLPVVTGYKQKKLSPQRSKLSVIPFSVLLQELGSLNDLPSNLELLETRLNNLLEIKSDKENHAKEISMLQQVISWIKMRNIL